MPLHADPYPVTFARHRIARLVLALAWAGGLHSASAQSELAPEVQASVKRNAEALNPITIKWRREGSSRMPLDTLLERIGLPEYARAFLSPLQATYISDDGRYFARFEYVRVSPRGDNGRPKLSAGVQEVAFDGQRRFVATPQNKESLGSVIIDPIANPVEAPKALMLMSNYLHVAGFVVAEQSGESGPPPRSLVLELIKQGAKIVRIEPRQVGDVKCLGVDLDSGTELRRFDLDPQLGYALRRQETRNSADQLIESIALSDFTEFPGHAGVWFPKRAEASFFQWHSKPSPPDTQELFRHTYTVTELQSSEVPESQFVIMYTTPGTSIADGSLPEAKESPTGRVSYLVPADPADLDATIRDAVDSLPHPPDEPGSLRMVMIFVNVLVILTLIGWMVARRFRRQRAG